MITNGYSQKNRQAYLMVITNLTIKSAGISKNGRAWALVSLASEWTEPTIPFLTVPEPYFILVAQIEIPASGLP